MLFGGINWRFRKSQDSDPRLLILIYHLFTRLKKKSGILFQFIIYLQDKKEIGDIIYRFQIKFIAFFIISSCWTNLLNSSASYCPSKASIAAFSNAKS